MKKVLLILMTLFSFNVLFVSGMVMERKNIPLEEGEEVDDKTDRPRTPALIPILCYYDNGMVSLEPLADLGEVQLTVTNQATGEQWSTSNNWMLETSTANGVYLVGIVFEDGTTYWGTYTLL